MYSHLAKSQTLFLPTLNGKINDLWSILWKGPSDVNDYSCEEISRSKTRIVGTLEQRESSGGVGLELDG